MSCCGQCDEISCRPTASCPVCEPPFVQHLHTAYAVFLLVTQEPSPLSDDCHSAAVLVFRSPLFYLTMASKPSCNFYYSICYNCSILLSVIDANFFLCLIDKLKFIVGYICIGRNIELCIQGLVLSVVSSIHRGLGTYPLQIRGDCCRHSEVTQLFSR